MKFSNGLTAAEVERLAILSEELGEAQQAIGKILRHGYESFDPSRAEEMGIETEGTNRCSLVKECGDILFAINMLTGASDLSRTNINARVWEKAEKIKPYLHHQG